LLEEEGFMTALFLAARSAALFFKIFTYPGTQQIRTEPLLVYENLSRVSQVEATAQKDSKTSCDMLINKDRSHIAIFRLFKQT
jgi:hypothetical protein